ncbi:MAG TPA: hypothetical protein VN668_13300 [Stellaceae bacterium]|nr:hypothetical protein [Stellaceae bacterium]
MKKNACREPSLDELLEDGAMRLLMASDQVEEAQLRALLDGVLDARPTLRRRDQAAGCCA